MICLFLCLCLIISYNLNSFILSNFDIEFLLWIANQIYHIFCISFDFLSHQKIFFFYDKYFKHPLLNRFILNYQNLILLTIINHWKIHCNFDPNFYCNLSILPILIIFTKIILNKG